MFIESIIDLRKNWDNSNHLSISVITRELRFVYDLIWSEDSNNKIKMVSF